MLQAVARPKPQANLSKELGRLFEIIRKKSLLRGQFTLASGATSDYYLDMKPTTLDPEGIALIAEDCVCGCSLPSGTSNSIGGLELGAVPLLRLSAQEVGQIARCKGFIVRKEKKGHGTNKKIDGNFRPNTRVILFDDVTTKGGSVLQAVHAVREQGATAQKVITIVDRLEGARENLAREGVELVPVFTTAELLSSG